MDTLSAAILGIVQGITEFLPISSSGHLVIFQNLLNVAQTDNKDLLLEVLLHLGTLVAVVGVFYKDIGAMIVEFFRLVGDLFRGKFRYRDMPPHRKMVVLVLIATLPLFAVVFVKDKIEVLYTSLIAVGFFLLLTGILLWLSDRMARGKKDMSTATPKDALVVGLFQAFATLPGVSRSGATITGGLFAGLTKEFAVKLSFILSIPAILGANILEVKDALSAGGLEANILPYLVGIVCAAVSGFLAIKLLQYIMKKNKFSFFAYYCFVVGLATLIWGFLR